MLTNKLENVRGLATSVEGDTMDRVKVAVAGCSSSLVGASFVTSLLVDSAIMNSGPRYQIACCCQFQTPNVMLRLSQEERARCVSAQISVVNVCNYAQTNEYIIKKAVLLW